MNKLELKKEYINEYCEFKNEYVRMLVMKHPLSNVIISKECDGSIGCKSSECKYASKDE